MRDELGVGAKKKIKGQFSCEAVNEISAYILNCDSFMNAYTIEV